MENLKVKLIKYFINKMQKIKMFILKVQRLYTSSTTI